MAKSILNAFNSLRSLISTSSSSSSSASIENSTYNPSEPCWILNLPPEILQTITDYVNISDIISLSRTCQIFYTIINDDSFWIHRIACQFPRPIANLYTHDLFQEYEHISTDDEPCPSGFLNIRTNGVLDLAAINSATHYNDEAIEKHHAQMYISKEDFLNNLAYFQYKKPKSHSKIPFMKLVYHYLVDRKRTAVVNMNVVHRNDHYLVERSDRDSLTGNIIYLQHVCWLEISGELEHKIMPGKYEVIWRMKATNGNIYIPGETEFSVVPSNGKMLLHKVSSDDFQNYALEHGNQWFAISMGHILVYELSTVFVGIRNWHNSSWKSGISWDCIELKCVP